jgi:hypothetical protein
MASLLVEIAAVVGAATPIVLAIIEKKESKKTESLTNESDVDLVVSEGNPSKYTRVFAFCFFIYALCGVLSGALSAFSNIYQTLDWIYINLVWVTGNLAIMYILFKHFRFGISK